MHFRLGLCLFLLLTGSKWLVAQPILYQSEQFLHPFDQAQGKALLAHIDQIAPASRIIGLGEVSHYTQECYTLKASIIERLFQHGYQGLILEVDFGQALIWNNYVKNGIGDLDSIVSNSGWFTYRTEEFKAVLAMIRDHNLAAAQPFQVFGMEMTTVQDNLIWMDQYLRENLPSTAEKMTVIPTDRPKVAFQSHQPEDQIWYWKLYHGFDDILTLHQDDLIKKGGATNFQIAQQIAEITRQYATYVSQNDFSLQIEFRDQFSSRNVLWCLDHLGEQSKVALWAHNGHVTKESVLSDYNVLGSYLHRWFGEAYYSIGFTFNEGEFGAFSANGFKRWKLGRVEDQSLTRELGALKQNYVLLDLKNWLLSSPATASRLEEEVLIRTDVSESFSEENPRVMPINLSNTYDCLIYIDHSHFPTTIPWTR